MGYKMNVSMPDRKIPYSEIGGTKVGPSHKKRRHCDEFGNTEDGTERCAVFPLTPDTKYNMAVTGYEDIYFYTDEAVISGQTYSTVPTLTIEVTQVLTTQAVFQVRVFHIFCSV